MTHRRSDLWVECVIDEEVHVLEQRWVCVDESGSGRG